MRTTAKMYRFTLYLDRVIPGFTDDDGALRFSASCHSLRGAAKAPKEERPQPTRAQESGRVLTFPGRLQPCT